MDIKQVEFIKGHVLQRIYNEINNCEDENTTQLLKAVHDDIEDIFECYLKIEKLKDNQFLDKIPF